jgi:hypothetical protein
MSVDYSWRKMKRFYVLTFASSLNFLLRTAQVIGVWRLGYAVVNRVFPSFFAFSVGLLCVRVMHNMQCVPWLKICHRYQAWMLSCVCISLLKCVN